MQFNLKGAKPGDKVSISWVDNRGDKRSGVIDIGGDAGLVAEHDEVARDLIRQRPQGSVDRRRIQIGDA